MNKQTSLPDLIVSTIHSVVGVGPVWQLMYQLTPFANCPCMDLATAEQMAQRLINIPSSPSLLRKVE